MIRGKDTRDIRVVAAVACPRCNAWIDQPCFHLGKPWYRPNGDPNVHRERREAWQEWKKTQPPLATA